LYKFYRKLHLKEIPKKIHTKRFYSRKVPESYLKGNVPTRKEAKETYSYINYSSLTEHDRAVDFWAAVPYQVQHSNNSREKVL
jgi:hypothetical protein